LQCLVPRHAAGVSYERFVMYLVKLWNGDTLYDDHSSRLYLKVMKLCKDHVSLVGGGPNLNIEHEDQVDDLFEEVMGTFKKTSHKYVYELFHMMTDKVVFSHERRTRVQMKWDKFYEVWAMANRDCPIVIRKVELFGPWPKGSGSC